MDLDDIVKVLLPKSKRKKLKKQLKKMDLGDMLKHLFKSLFRSNKQSRSKSMSKSNKYATPSVERHIQAAPRQSSFLSRQKDPIQEAIRQARNYDKKISALARKAPRNSIEKMRLTTISQNVKEWVQTIEQIAQRLQNQSKDPLLAKEQAQVPQAIKRLENQLQNTTDEKVRTKLNLTLENRRKQLAQLEQSTTNRQLSELKIENTLAQLGIIYSQIVSEPFIAQQGNYDRLSAEIHDEVLALEDYLSSLDELQKGEMAWT